MAVSADDEDVRGPGAWVRVMEKIKIQVLLLRYLSRERASKQPQASHHKEGSFSSKQLICEEAAVGVHIIKIQSIR